MLCSLHYPYRFLPTPSINYWERNAELSNYNISPVTATVIFCFMYFEAQILGRDTLSIIVSSGRDTRSIIVSWRIGPLWIVCLSLVIFVPKSIATPVFFCLSLQDMSFFHHFTFNLFVSLYLKRISYRWHLGMLTPFTFNVIYGMAMFISHILLFSPTYTHLSHMVLVSFFLFSWFLLGWVLFYFFMIFFYFHYCLVSYISLSFIFLVAAIGLTVWIFKFSEVSCK